MDPGLWLQYLLIGAAALASAVVVMHKQFPSMTRRLRIALALPLLRDGAPSWLRCAGHAIAPAPRASGKNCGGCDSCD